MTNRLTLEVGVGVGEGAGEEELFCLLNCVGCSWLMGWTGKSKDWCLGIKWQWLPLPNRADPDDSLLTLGLKFYLEEGPWGKWTWMMGNQERVGLKSVEWELLVLSDRVRMENSRKKNLLALGSELGLYLKEGLGDEATGCQVNGWRGKISSGGEEMEVIGWQLGWGLEVDLGLAFPRVDPLI
jgi:hypothetical protein